MALVIRGASKCSICGEILAEGQPIVAFPAFLTRTDEHYRCSDSGMHQCCFEGWEHRDAVLHKYRVATGEIRAEPALLKTRIAILGSQEERDKLHEQLRKLDQADSETSG